MSDAFADLERACFDLEQALFATRKILASLRAAPAPVPAADLAPAPVPAPAPGPRRRGSDRLTLEANHSRVCRFIAEGKPPRVVAALLGVSPGNYRNYVYQNKLGNLRPGHREWTEVELRLARALRSQGKKSADFVKIFECTRRQAHCLWLAAVDRSPVVRSKPAESDPAANSPAAKP